MHRNRLVVYLFVYMQSFHLAVQYSWVPNDLCQPIRGHKHPPVEANYHTDAKRAGEDFGTSQMHTRIAERKRAVWLWLHLQYLFFFFFF